MFRERVVQHYAERGYRVQEDVRIRGGTGRVHPVDLVAQGPLGNLVVTVCTGDGGTELAALRVKAKDLGVTGVLAVPEASGDLRRAAARMGIAILESDELALEAPVLETKAAWPDAARKANVPAAVVHRAGGDMMWEAEDEPEPVAAGPSWLHQLADGKLPDSAPEAAPEPVDDTPLIDVIGEPAFLELEEDAAPAVKAPLRRVGEPAGTASAAARAVPPTQPAPSTRAAPAMGAPPTTRTAPAALPVTPDAPAALVPEAPETGDITLAQAMASAPDMRIDRTLGRGRPKPVEQDAVAKPAPEVAAAPARSVSDAPDRAPLMTREQMAQAAVAGIISGLVLFGLGIAFF